MELNDTDFTIGTPGAYQARMELKRALNPRIGEQVCIGYPHLDTFGANFVDSVLRTIAYDKTHGDHLMHNSGLRGTGALAAAWGRSIELSHARNTIAAAFMASSADWLLWWDTDIGCEPNAVEALLAAADPDTAPIVGGLCFIENEYQHDFHGGLQSSLAPTLYDWSWTEPANGMPGAYKLATRPAWTPGEVTRVGATGTGFLLTHRSVYEKISTWLMDQGAPGHIWFERIPGPDGELCGEDISFCMRAHQVGLPVFVHTGVTTTHQKTVWYGAPEYRTKPFAPPAASVRVLPPEQWPKLMVNPHAAAQAEQNSPIREQQVPEATEKVAVIVPVARRNNAEQFMASLDASLTPRQRDRVEVYVMTDSVDEAVADAWRRADKAGAEIHVDRHHYRWEMGSFAEKVNRGFGVSGEPWLFLVGDDVRFHPGWLDQALHVARITGAHVVGTNDLGNAAVMAGQHATHMFISRSYVADFGASLDGPRLVSHEGYRHWYVDNEIVELAKLRNVWAPCLASHVEHLHPLFGKGEADEVYAIGQAAAEADRMLWVARHRLMIENEGVHAS
jgi:hypothetical protein